MSSEWTRWVAGIAAEIPPAWSYKESLTLLAPEWQANIIFSSEPLDEQLSSRRYAEVQQAVLRREFPGWEPRSELTAHSIAGLDETGWIRDFTWQPPGRPRVRQVQIYGVAGLRGWTATATAETDAFLERESELLDALDRLSVTLGRPEGLG